MITFITYNSNLVPLLEGRLGDVAQIHVDLSYNSC